jgi:hypothetical protein
MAFLPAIGLIAGLAGTAVSAVGMIQQGRQQNQAAKYQAQVDENNATRAGYSAIQAQEQAQREAGDIAAQRRRVLSQNIASASRSGLGIGGSVVDVMTDTALQAEQDIQMAIYRGDTSAYNYANEAASSRSNAKFSRMSGRNAVRGSYLSAGGSLLSNTSSLGLSYATYSR